MRLGYMGHLTLIAEEVCKFAERNPPELLGDHMMERVMREDWVRYVEGTLTETRDKDNAVLGGVRPENAAGLRNMGGGSLLGQSTFSGNTGSNTLADAGLAPADSMALADNAGGTAFDGANRSAGLLSGFGSGDDDEEEEESFEGERGNRPLTDDEQVGELSFDDVDMNFR